MKKVFAWGLALCLLLGLAACDWFNPKPPPTTRPQTTVEAPPVTLYLPNENADGFVTVQAKTDGTVADIVALLVAEGGLPAGCEPLSFLIDNWGVGKLDMNEAFREAVSTTGTTGEMLRFGSLVNTLLTYFGMESVFVTAEGQVIETGHNTYDYALGFINY